MKLLIDAEVAQSVLNYMAQRPYAEVYKLVSGLTNLKVAQEEATIVVSDEAAPVEAPQQN